MPHDSEELLSAQQVADRFGIAEKTVRRWIDDGRLVAGRRGRAFAIRLADAEVAFAESRAGRARAAGSFEAERAARLEFDNAELRGRYAELRDQVARLEAALAEERRRTAVLEAERGLRAA